jgi:hypothetical protein
VERVVLQRKARPNTQRRDTENRGAFREIAQWRTVAETRPGCTTRPRSPRTASTAQRRPNLVRARRRGTTSSTSPAPRQTSSQGRPTRAGRTNGTFIRTAGTPSATSRGAQVRVDGAVSATVTGPVADRFVLRRRLGVPSTLDIAAHTQHPSAASGTGRPTILFEDPVHNSTTTWLVSPAISSCDVSVKGVWSPTPEEGRDGG